MDVMIALGAGCLLIRLGLTLYRTGLLRAKNAAGAVLRVFADLCVSTLAFWLIGAAILLQMHNQFFWVDPKGIAFSSGGTAELFFLMTVILIGTGIVGGALAERTRFFPAWAASILAAAVLIPVGGNWAWSGWLARLGFIDAAGGSWLHLGPALCALIGAMTVGPRSGKYHRDGSTTMIPGHNIPLIGVGVAAMLAGWVPYLAGCLIVQHEAALIGPAAVSALLAGASAGMAALLVGHYRYGKPDVILTLFGFLGGLVSITAGAGRIEAPWAVLLGAVAGVLVTCASVWIDLIAHIDDPIGVIAVHGVGGLWGTLAAGFLTHGSALQRLHQTGVQLIGILAIGLLSLILAAATFAILKAAIRIRASEADEFDGLDLAQHDIGAYPDFQQNTIKSYHLREA
jgi:ammonium transporter, Amt family